MKLYLSSIRIPAPEELAALVAGTSIAGIESADVMPTVKSLHKSMIELKDSQAVIFDGDKHWIIEAKNES